jgi:hypothetical protein
LKQRDDVLTAFGLALSFACAPAGAAIQVDGKLDEPEWQAAQALTGFKTTEPYTQAEPKLQTKVLVHADGEGLYVAFICDQPADIERVRTHGQRDQVVAGDRVNLMVDFNGTGATGYEFTAFLGGEYMDAVINRQVTYNYDWDGDWEYAVSETPERWFVEYRIPWSTAPMAEAKDGQRTMGLFASRVVVKTGERYSLPPNAFMRATFVSDMRKVQIKAFERAQLDLYPYAGATHDAKAPRTQGRAGFDLFWKPNGRHQLTATVNPDFGQVESDELVVNFTAIPTFFPDKRPFFTENLGLFTTDIPTLYTRRIGAAPDAGPEGVTDILGALKYTGASGDLAYGAIAAFEDDSTLAQGRDFYVGRVRQKLSDALTVGWIGTHVERPTLGRRADVNSVDFRWTIAPGISLDGQGLLGHVENDNPTILDPAGRGEGGRFTFGYAPGGRLETSTYLVLKNQDYNVNDAGFQQRPSEHIVQNVTSYYWRDFAPESGVQQRYVQSNLIYHRNDSGDPLPTTWILFGESDARDTSFTGIELDVTTLGGVDDIFTRGNGPVRLPTRYQLFPYYGNSRSGMFRYLIVPGFGTGYYDDAGWWFLKFEPGLYPSPELSLTMTAKFIQSPDEILWLGGDLVGTFDYQEQTVASDVNWFPAPRHSVRVKFQWIGASGNQLAAYRPNASGDLLPAADPLQDFSFTTTALQVRYRWEFAPLSEFFLVYSQGGTDALAEPESDLGSSLRRGLAQETDRVFLAKLRYRFALLD